MARRIAAAFLAWVALLTFVGGMTVLFSPTSASDPHLVDSWDVFRALASGVTLICISGLLAWAATATWDRR